MTINHINYKLLPRVCLYWLIGFILLATGCTGNVGEVTPEIGIAEENTQISEVDSEPEVRNEELENSEVGEESPPPEYTQEPEGASKPEVGTEEQEDSGVDGELHPTGTSESDPTIVAEEPEDTPSGTGELIPEPYLFLPTNSYVFSMQNAQHTTPNDVLRELAYTGGYGGGRGPCELDTLEPLFFDFYGERESFEWVDSIKAYACGWEINEPVQVIFGLPNEEPLVEYTEISKSYDPIYALEFSYKIPLNTSPGEYELKFIGKSNSLETSVEVILPDEPRLYLVDNQLVFYNFAPQENIRLFVYRGMPDEIPHFFPLKLEGSFYGFATLEAWNTFQVNEKGQLLINIGEIHDDNNDYIVLGNESGEIHVYLDFPPTGSPAKSPYDIHPLRPGQNEIDQIDYLWRAIAYKDLKAPGTQRYDISVDSNEHWIWGFSWCAVNENTLIDILHPLSISFYINEIRLYDAQLLEYRFTASDGWQCRSWKTLLENWPKGENIVLEVRYSLSEGIYDGSQSYPAGEYHQIIDVYVNP